MEKITDYFSRFITWLFESKQILTVAIPSIFIFAFRNHLGQECIEFLGGIMQLVGTIFAIYSFVKVREYFLLPSLKNLFCAWVKRFPKWNKHVPKISGVLVIPSLTSSGNVSNWSMDDPNLPIEERVNNLIKNQEALRKSLEKNEVKISVLEIAFTEKIENLSGDFSTKITELYLKLKSIHTDDFLWAFTWLLFILIGTIFSVFAKYLVRINFHLFIDWFNWAWKIMNHQFWILFKKIIEII